MIATTEKRTLSKKPACSICIANYNGEATLSDCLNSVFSQGHTPPFEVIVHDDASTDDSVSLVQNNYPDVRLIRSETNVGFCISNNRMASEAQGTYLLLLNNDAALRKGALSLFYKESEQGYRGILGMPQYNLETGDLIDRGSLFDIFLNAVPNRDPKRREVGMVAGACLWIPKELWTHIGGFPEWFGSFAEDLYLCCAARNLGHDVCVLEGPGYDHRVGHSFGGGKLIHGKLSTTYRRRALSERNKTFVMILFYPPVLLAVILPLHILVLAVEGAMLTIIKTDKNILNKIYAKSISQVWKARLQLRSSRNKAQASRQIGLRSFLSNFVVLPYKLKMLIRYGLPRIS